MSKPSLTAIPVTKASEPTGSKPQIAAPQDAGRETLESIAFAFVLALLFRTFVAEAFVIPTGSMAPTLFGRNKEVVCTECKIGYEVGASEEVNEEGYLVLRIEDSICPNCRHRNKIKDLNAFKGDRILVNKFTYQMGQPERWDVIVFRYPEDVQKNYIKRLVGLPGETILISRGDVYARQGDQGDFQILRKQDPNKQKVLQQLVYDDRHPPRDLLAKGWPERWSPMTKADVSDELDGWGRDDQGWKHDPETRSFAIESTDESKWIRYQHLLPSLPDWSAPDAIEIAQKPRPKLITDFCGYNTYSGGQRFHVGDDRFWVGDLTLSCTVEIKAVQGTSPELVLELVEGVRRYRCRIDVTTGQARLLRNEELSADPGTPEVVMASAATPVRGPGTYTLSFANVDDRLCLWVNSGWSSSGLIPFGTGAEFMAPANPKPQAGDLIPAGVAAHGISARVTNLLLQRDIYYRADSVSNEAYQSRPDEELPESVRIHDALSDPEKYGDLYSRNKREAQFRALGPDDFFVMGDNSPRSQDSRLWSNQRRAANRHAVPRSALLGKAFFIYWPHGIPFLNNGHGFTVMNHSPHRDDRGDPIVKTYPEYVAPFYPQWWRWKRIR